jgi:hypothetical protein
VDTVRPGGETGFSLTGRGALVGEWDESGARDTHVDLRGRIANRDGSGLSDHSTHLAGTIAGSGAGDPLAEGMAPGAAIFSYSWELDLVEMSNEAWALGASSHAYGPALGWQENPACPEQWSWAGERGDREDPRFGHYGDAAAALDRVVRQTDLLSIWAAGNDRDDGPPSPLSRHAHFPSCDADFSDEHETERELEHDTLGGGAVAKNVLTVGAIEDLPDTWLPSDIRPLPSSSFGPTDDGRIKPDVAAGGDGVRSTAAETDDAYAVRSGSSSAAAAVAGIAALLIEAYRTHHGGRDPRASELKAALVQTAEDAGALTGPDYAMGHGLVNAEGAAELVSSTGPRAALLVDVLTGPPSTLTTSDVPARTPLRVTLAWMDPPGPARDPGDTTPVLENDLDLELVAPDGVTVFHPWSLDPEQPDAAAKRDVPNRVDTVEVIDVDARDNTMDGVWTLRVSASRELLRGEPQTFALAASVPISEPRHPILGSQAHLGLIVPRGGKASLSIPIENLGFGTLEWAASTDASFIELERSSGTGGDDLVVMARASDLPSAEKNLARIEVESNDPGGPRSIGLVVETACTPDCSGRACGPDPQCGTSCGRCAAHASCTPLGTCVPLAESCPDADLGTSLGGALVTATTSGASSLSASCGGELAADAGFTWTAPRAGRFAFSTEGSGFDTVLSVRRGGCSGLELGCNDDALDLSSTLVVELESGQTVTAVVDGFDGESGVFSLGIHEARCPDGELDGELGSRLLPESSPGRLDRLRASCAPPAARETALGFTAPVEGTYRFDASGSNYETSVAVLDGDCSGVELACSEDAAEVELTALQHVVIVVDGAIAPEDQFALAVSTRALTCGNDCAARPGDGLCACDERCVELGDCCVDACGGCASCAANEDCEFGRCIPRRCIGNDCTCNATGGTGGVGCDAGAAGEPGEAGRPPEEREEPPPEPSSCSCRTVPGRSSNGLGGLLILASFVALASRRARIYKASHENHAFLGASLPRSVGVWTQGGARLGDARARRPSHGHRTRQEGPGKAPERQHEGASGGAGHPALDAGGSTDRSGDPAPQRDERARREHARRAHCRHRNDSRERGSRSRHQHGATAEARRGDPPSVLRRFRPESDRRLR